MSTKRKIVRSQAQPSLATPPSSITYATLAHTDDEILKLFKPSVRKWWIDTFSPMRKTNNGYFTPPQRLAITAHTRGQERTDLQPDGLGQDALGVHVHHQRAIPGSEVRRRAREQRLLHLHFTAQVAGERHTQEPGGAAEDDQRSLWRRPAHPARHPPWRHGRRRAGVNAP